MKKIKKYLKYFVIFFTLIYFFSLILYQTNFIHWGMQKFCFRSQIGCFLEDKIHALFTPFNFYKVIYKNSIPKDKYIDLKFSPNELKYVQEKVEYFLETGFIEDSSNEWRDASILIDGKFEEVKYKFQGTSITALKHSRGLLWGILKKLKIKNDSNFDMRYMSINIKHKKKSKNLKNIRRYTLKSTFDDQDIAVIAMNSVAKNMGLVARHSEYKIVRSNLSLLSASSSADPCPSPISVAFLPGFPIVITKPVTTKTKESH